MKENSKDKCDIFLMKSLEFPTYNLSSNNFEDNDLNFIFKTNSKST